MGALRCNGALRYYRYGCPRHILHSMEILRSSVHIVTSVVRSLLWLVESSNVVVNRVLKLTQHTIDVSLSRTTNEGDRHQSINKRFSMLRTTNAFTVSKPLVNRFLSKDGRGIVAYRIIAKNVGVLKAYSVSFGITWCRTRGPRGTTVPTSWLLVSTAMLGRVQRYSQP